MIKIKKINDLLFEVFDNKRFIKIDYLKWLYRSSPEGKEISSEHIEKGRFRGHFCTLPQIFENDKNKKHLLFGHILNIAVADDMRGRGIFITLAKKCIKENIRKGTDALWGVANANTTHGYVAYLKFKLICGLPVKIGLAMPISKTNTYNIDKKFLKSKFYNNQIDNFTFYNSSDGFKRKWDYKLLNFRLSSPIGNYFFTINQGGILISTFDEIGPMKIMIILKIFSKEKKMNSTYRNNLIRSACKKCSTIFYLYTGFNKSVDILGVPLPRKILPSPLNLIYRPLSKSSPPKNKMNFHSIEFLDFDAY